MERLFERRAALAILGLPPALLLCSSLAGCDTSKPQDAAMSASTTDLTASVEAASSSQESIGDLLMDQAATLAAYSFTARLLQETCSAEPQKNVLVSPLSALFALGLAEAGAAGETLSQLEAATGMDADGLTSYLNAYARRISGESLYDAAQKGDALALKSANSIWLRDSDSLAVSDSYLAACKDSFSAQAFSAPFDATTLDDINSWVSSKTDGMIDRIVDEISGSDQLFLIDALAFDDGWYEPFDDGDVQDDIFTTEDGDQQNVRMMHSHETVYLENDLAEGFLKPYEGYDFAFVALLPKQGTKLADLVSSFDGTSLHDLATTIIPDIEVDAGLPKFSLSFETTLNDQLAAMGVQDAFDPGSADFSRMGSVKDGNLAISRVVQKTFIDVNETGTKAAAATSAGMSGSSAAQAEPEVREVILNRPFAYLIIDYVTSTVAFAGIVASMK